MREFARAELRHKIACENKAQSDSTVCTSPKETSRKQLASMPFKNHVLFSYSQSFDSKHLPLVVPDWPTHLP